MARRVKASETGWSHGGAPGSRWRLKLYIAGQGGKSLLALANLKRLCAEQLTRAEVEVIDLVKNPALAKQDGIVAIPTLVRVGAGPARRVVGDLSNAERVLNGLNLQAG